MLPMLSDSERTPVDASAIPVTSLETSSFLSLRAWGPVMIDPLLLLVRLILAAVGFGPPWAA
jgi:hypothetical protein